MKCIAFVVAVTICIWAGFAHAEQAPGVNSDPASLEINGAIDKWQAIAVAYQKNRDKKLLPNILKLSEDVDRIASKHCQKMDLYASNRLIAVRCEEAAEYACISLLHTAKFFASAGEKNTAKKLFRHIITKYTGGTYNSYVKQAEFGLEDLKAKATR